MTWGPRAASILLFLWAWCMSWYKLGFYTYQLSAGSGHIEVRAPLYMLIVGLAISNLLGCHYFLQQERYVMAVFAGLGLDVPFTAVVNRRAILQDEACPDFETLQIRTTVWRSIPLAMISLYMAARSLIEMPLCQAAVILTLPAITHRIGDYTHTSVFQIFTELEWEDIDVVYGGRYRNPMGNHTRRMLTDIIWTNVEPSNYLWKEARCDLSQWSREYCPQDQAVLIPTTSVPKEGYGTIGHGNLRAAGVALGQMARQALLTTGVDLQQTVAALIGGIVKRKKGSSWGTAFTWGLNYAASWEWIVDKIFDMVQNALDFSTARSKWPRQSRSLWQIPVAAALLVSSSLPLVKAIKRARSIEVKSDQLLLGLHGALDVLMLVIFMLLCFIGPAVDSLERFGLRIVNSFVDLLLQEAAKAYQNNLGLKIFDFLERGCGQGTVYHADHACQDEFPVFEHYVQNHLLEAYQNEMQVFLDAVHDLSVPDSDLLLQALGFCIFFALSVLIARVLLGKMRLSTAGLLNVGITGPMHLAALAPKSDLEEVLESITILIPLRGAILTVVLYAAWGSRNPEPFTAFALNHPVNLFNLQFAWLVLWFAHVFTGWLGVSALRSYVPSDEEFARTNAMQPADYGATGSILYAPPGLTDNLGPPGFKREDV
ncbi:unnamed protein product [Durusdinium trenchii]|uniref:Uncharacterized protein n=1 Tax=Durusdinium trenchii TaxID=1381693 RepID=A0ABP0JHY2_9DINO